MLRLYQGARTVGMRGCTMCCAFVYSACGISWIQCVMKDVVMKAIALDDGYSQILIASRVKRSAASSAFSMLCHNLQRLLLCCCGLRTDIIEALKRTRGDVLYTSQPTALQRMYIRCLFVLSASTEGSNVMRYCMMMS